MRYAVILALSLLVSSALTAQTTAPSGTGHFEGWPFSAQWGSDKQSFEATTITRLKLRLGLFTVAERGFGWRPAFADTDGSFVRWEEVSAWCAGPGTLRIRTGEALRPISYENIEGEDLATIVDAYFRTYAATKEPSGPDMECTSGSLQLPGPRNRIIQLLEAASKEAP